MSTVSSLPMLGDIVRDTQHFIQNACVQPQSPTYRSSVIRRFRLPNLPSPQPLLPSLLEAGVTSEIASAASQIYQRRIEALKQHIQESIATTCCEAAESPVLRHVSPPDLLTMKVMSIFTNIYFRRLEEWKEEIVQRVMQASKLPTSTAAPRNGRTFNHVGTPTTQMRLLLIYLAGIRSTIGALFRRKPVPDASRQDVPRQKVKYGVQANPCMGESLLESHLIGVTVVDPLSPYPVPESP